MIDLSASSNHISVSILCEIGMFDILQIPNFSKEYVVHFKQLHYKNTFDMYFVDSEILEDLESPFE